MNIINYIGILWLETERNQSTYLYIEGKHYIPFKSWLEAVFGFPVKDVESNGNIVRIYITRGIEIKTLNDLFTENYDIMINNYEDIENHKYGLCIELKLNNE